jgi:gliding motility-associated-like protein
MKNSLKILNTSQKKNLIGKIYLLFFLLLIPFLALSQKEINYFIFGETIANFNYDPPVLQSLPPTSGDTCLGGAVASSCMSDKNGKFMFCGDPMILRDTRLLTGSKDIMKNGIINCWKVAHNGILITPIPDNDTLFYAFSTTTLNGCISNVYLKMALVNIRGNSGLGEVVNSFNKIIDSVITPLAAVRHSNNKDIWLICHAGDNPNYSLGKNQFYAFLITKNGIDTIPVISTVGFKHKLGYYSGMGTLRFSIDGTMLVKTMPIDYDNTKVRCELYNFDKSSGKFTFNNEINNFTQIQISNISYNRQFGSYGASFSPNGRFLYVCSNYWKGTSLPHNDSSLLTYNIYQFDVSSKNDSIIDSSRVLVFSGKYSMIGDLQNTPNEEIWFEKKFKLISAIIRPNIKGLGCMYNDNLYNLGTSNVGGQHCMPNFIQSYLERRIDISSNCQQIPIQLSTNVAHPDSFFWDFGDPAAGISNISRLYKPIHNFVTTGYYKVRLIAYEDGYADTVTRLINIGSSYHQTIDTFVCEGDSFFTGIRYLSKAGNYIDSLLSVNGCDSINSYKISIRNKPVADLGNDSFFCEGNSITLTSKNLADSYNWSTGETGSSINISNGGTYWVKCIKNGCSDTDSIFITKFPIPFVDLGSDLGFCKNENLPIVLDAGIAYKYFWSPGGDTSRYLTINDTGKYSIIVSNINNCVNSDSINIVDNCKMIVYIPNAFMPKGINTIFRVYGVSIGTVEIKIFNRWGGLIFKGAGDENTGWDGYYSNQLCSTGVYYYSISVCTKTGDCIRKTGMVHLIW